MSGRFGAPGVRRRVRAVRARLSGLRRHWIERRQVVLTPGLGRPVGSADNLAEARTAIEMILVRNLLPFWRTLAADSSGPGYTLNHDVRGVFVGPGNIRLVSQARVLWALARLARTEWAHPTDLGHARRGFALLTGPLRDCEHGGFFWEMDRRAGNATMADKHLYGHAFALFALSTFALAEGSDEAMAAARAAFAVLEERFRDRECGGYLETFRRDWSLVPPDQPGYLGAPASVKLHNSHLHVLEALTAYLELTGEPAARARVEEMTGILVGCLSGDPISHYAQAYDRDWKRLDPPAVRRVSYGHDLETVTLLIRAFKRLGYDDAHLHDRYFAMGHAALQFAEDPLLGGVFAAGPVGAAADDRLKHSWVQAESLLAFAELHRLSGDAIQRDVFLRTLNWIINWQCDWVRGEWFTTIDVAGRASGLKAGPWGGPYHGVRAMVDCLEILQGRTVPSIQE